MQFENFAINFSIKQLTEIDNWRLFKIIKVNKKTSFKCQQNFFKKNNLLSLIEQFDDVDKKTFLFPVKLLERNH